MPIYKICSRTVWEASLRAGFFIGMPIDLADGYVHFSTLEQLPDTMARSFSDETDLVLLTVDSAALGTDLRWEPSSSGKRAGLFPHLYGTLPVSAILKASTLSSDIVLPI